MNLNEGLVYTSKDCIGCNKCIKGCPVLGANIAVNENGSARIIVDDSKCVRCGQCIKNCEHNARHYHDDFDSALSALSEGAEIDLLVAPSFFLVYKDNYASILGYLRTLGFKHIYNVSFGANITSWAFVSYLKSGGKKGLISSACPVVVSYIEKYKPELIDYLMPLMTPVACLKTYLEISEPSSERKFAFLSPCVGKHDEVSTHSGGTKLDFSFTFKRLNEHIENNKIELSDMLGSCDELTDFALGKFYPVPGGLKNSVNMFYDSNEYIKQIEGTKQIFKYFDFYSDLLKDENAELPLYIDVLNCEGGCVEGVASESMEKNFDSYSIQLNNAYNNATYKNSRSAIKKKLSVDVLFKKFSSLMNQKGIKYTDFFRTFNTHAKPNESNISASVIESTFKKLHKYTPEARSINCQSCGYSSCKNMAIAIAHGYNRPENCIHYAKDALEREQKDLMNLVSTVYGNGSIAEANKMDSEYIVQVLSKAFNEIELTREKTFNDSQAKSRFFASMTHELRTPLHAIISMAENAKKSLPEGESSEYLDSILSAGNQLLETINELLDMSKIDSGNFNIINSEYELLPVLNDVCNLIRFRCMEKKLAFDHLFEPSLPEKLIGDKKRITQILINLLGNAVKYTNVGGVTFNVSWNKNKDNPVLVFSIIDSGIGIKEKDIPFLFDAYKQVDEAKNHNIEGTGLGLSIVKALADEMNAKVDVSSKYGFGSTFTVMLPQAIENYSPIPADNVTSKKSSAPAIVFPHANILVVDDMSVNLKIMAEFMDRYQVPLTLCSSGEEAIEKCKQNTFDLIFMDFQMPTMNGLKAIDLIRSTENLNRNTHIVILSAEDEFSNSDAVLFQGFLSKPIDRNDLENSLLKYMPSDKIERVENDVLPPKDIFAKYANENLYEEYMRDACIVERIAKAKGFPQIANVAKYQRLAVQLRMYEQITPGSAIEFDAKINELREAE